jgi:hypothetical protein
MLERARLGDHVDVLTGFPFRSAQYTDDERGVRLLRGDNILQARLRWDNVKRWSSEGPTDSRWVPLRDGDVVLAMDRPWIEAGLKFACLRQGDVPSLLVQRVACLRAKPTLDQRFLGYLIGSGAFTTYVLGIQTGTAVPHISAQQIKGFTFPMLPLSTQRSIAEVIEVLDEKIAVNENVAKVAWNLAEAHFADCFLDSDSWQRLRIADVADIFDGPHATPTKVKEGPWFLSISSLRHGFLDLNESARISEDDFRKWTRRVTPRAGDVLFSYETRLGEAALMPAGVRACLGRRMALMRPRENHVLPYILLFLFLGNDFQVKIRSDTVRGATVDRIPLTEFPSWEIKLPDEDIQARLAGVLRPLYNRALSSIRETQILTELRGTLLPRLISGELRIRNLEKVLEDAT